MPDAGQNYRLDDLKLRWEREPASRIFLQLADEYRKLDQPLEAVAVLEKGLEHRPNDLSALVALGRCRLELDQVNEAIAALETVISRDPTHIVANKLLLDAYLQQGDAERAGARLETYRLLNSRDPELDHLEYRLERLLADQPAEASTVVADEFVAQETVSNGAFAEETVIDDSEGFELVGEETAPDDGETAGKTLNTKFRLEDELDLDDEDDDSSFSVSSNVSEPAVSEPAVSEPAVSEPAVSEPAVSESAGEAFVSSPVASSQGLADPEESSETWAKPFQLTSQDLPEPDLAALWSHHTSSSQRLADPFVGLTQADGAQHWAALTREGIFSTRTSGTTVLPEAAVAEEVEPAVGDEVESAVGEEAEPAVAEDAGPVLEAAAPVTVDSQVTDLRPETDSAELKSPESSEPDAADDSSVVSGWVAGTAALAGAAVASSIGRDDASQDSDSEPATTSASAETESVVTQDPEPELAEAESVEAESVEVEPAAAELVEARPVEAVSIDTQPAEAELLETEVADAVDPEVSSDDSSVALDSIGAESAIDSNADVLAEVASADASAELDEPSDVDAMPLVEASVAKPDATTFDNVASAGPPEAEVAAQGEESALEPDTEAAQPDLSDSAIAEPASATLGNLYLQQGHRDEAERIFRQVLENEPGNAVALAGLSELEGREESVSVVKNLTAADLLAVRSTSGKIPEGLTAKKILVLDNYIKHLRVGHHVH